MTKPRVICHMHTMLNGKVDGIANISEPGMASQYQYHGIVLGGEPSFG